jgi:aryl-alcohol dehydrogenase-like predicted oxidoreductase
MKTAAKGLVSLGATGVRVSPIGVGTNSWGARRESDPGKSATFKALHRAGITLFDTAEIYTGGASERTIGSCIKESRHTPVVLTKFFPTPWRLRGAALPAALGRSLKRLQLPRVDVYLLHFPLPPVKLETWINALADVVDAGLARAVGVSNCNAEQMRRAHATLAARGIPLACNEVEYSLLRRGPESNGLLALCKELGVTLIAYRPLRMGMLTGTYSPANPPPGLRSLMFGRGFLTRLQPLNAALLKIGKKHKKTASQVAINWVICKGALPIPGAKNERQARENAGAMGWRLTAREVAELEAACP